MTSRVERTQYAVPGWGVGELWTDDGLVLVHEFAYEPVSDTAEIATPASSHSSVARRNGSRAQISSSGAGKACGTTDAESARLSLDKNRCLTPKELVECLTAFLEGDDVSLADVPLDLDWATPFQRAVADALREIRRGEVVTYGELAAVAGYPGAARAVGTFCAQNRFMFFVPCHRVVGAGGIGGYGSAGVGVKRRLLELEGVTL